MGSLVKDLSMMFTSQASCSSEEDVQNNKDRKGGEDWQKTSYLNLR